MRRIGVDIGGTFIKAGAVEEGRLLSRVSVPTGGDQGDDAIFSHIYEAVRLAAEQVNDTPESFAHIGFGIPGAVDSASGLVMRCPNLGGWKRMPFVSEWQSRYHLPAHIGNDANCAVLGEAVSGAAAGEKNVLLLTLGTGVGGGIIAGGKLLEGSDGLAAELGHLCLVPGGRRCGCGMKGCLEAYCSVSALVKDTKRAMRRYPGSAMHRIAEENGIIDGRTAFDAAKTGDEAACRVVDFFCEHLALAIGTLVTVFRPESVLIGGGLSNQGRNLTDRLNALLPPYVFASSLSRLPEIKTAALKNDAGIIGAAYLDRF